MFLMQHFPNLQAIQNELSSATVGAECMIEFERDRIELKIPKDGVVKEGWSITPLAAPVVSKLTPVAVAYLLKTYVQEKGILITVQVISNLSCVLLVTTERWFQSIRSKYKTAIYHTFTSQ